MRTTFLAAASVGAIILMSHGSAVKAAELKVIAAAPMTAVFKEIGPLFERDTGHKLVIRIAPTPAVKREIDTGETFDLAISITSGIDDLIKEGKIIGGTRAAVAFAGVGVGVRAGAPKPDISSVDAVKRTLLTAKSVAHSAEGASVAIFKGLLEHIGISEEMKPKLKPLAGTGLRSFVSGEAEIVVLFIPTIVAAPKVELVGPFPSELQTYISFTAGMSTSVKEPEAAQALLKFLTSPAAVAVIRAKGMEPGAPR
jgi:molybdate transport system substrate-binding protein